MTWTTSRVRFSVWVLGVAGVMAMARPTAALRTPDFDRDIKPILSNNCYACHGPDEQRRKAELRLDTRKGVFAKTMDESIVVVPGKPGESELLRRITSEDQEEHMPPAKSGKKLSAEQVDTVRRWIEGGAPYDRHWAYVAPKRPGVPKVDNNGWVRNPIDAFVLARLEEKGLHPSPEADRYTLIRRLSQDLTGLPPSVADVDAFVKDTSPDAYEKVVEKYLASPRYGEKMAMRWLDLARFADTSGYHYDSTRQMWLWRDYVINAFNSNKPFDQFTIEQLAGDLIPNATVEQQIASGFNRNTRFNEEGGADPAEFSVRYAMDRVETLGTTWLGTTLMCAECHSHKYDPITQKEFYQLYAFFNSLEEPMVSGNHGQALPPLLKVPTDEQKKTLADANAGLTETRKQIGEALVKVSYKDPIPAGSPEARLLPPMDVVWFDDALPEGATAASGSTAPWIWSTKGQPALSGSHSTRGTGKGLQQSYFQECKAPLTIHKGDRIFTFAYLDPADPPKTICVQFFSGNWEHRAYWGADTLPWGGNGSASRKPMGQLPQAGKWVRLEVPAQEVGLAPGAVVTGMAFTQVDGTAYYDRAGAYTAEPPDGRLEKSLLIWEMTARKSMPAGLPGDVQAAIKVEPAKRNPAQKKTIQDYYVQSVWADGRATFGPLQAKTQQFETQITQTEAAVPFCMVSKELKERRKAYVLIRGDFQQHGEEVHPDVPALFPALPADKPKDRLALAKWLVDGKNPTVARVTVNRLWAQVFGTGLFKTLGDVGTQGERPTHPELLDWLAVEFVEKGWDVKHIMRVIVTSNTYRQSAKVNPAYMQVDAQDRLLWRSPRYRLAAEEIRDGALAIAGLLSPHIGGPSVNPYQPDGYYNGKFGWSWNTSKGEDLYRRGLYTFWRRTSLYPTFVLFDAPSREVCTADRARTNTPLQALALMNDPEFVEASRVFAAHIMRQGGATVDEKVTWAMRHALARTPSAREVSIVRQAYERQLAIFQKDPKKAEGLLSEGQSPRPKDLNAVEHGAWTAVARAILGLDETIVRE